MSAPSSPPWPRRPALFLDLDGTLVEIAEEPLRAVPSARLRALLPLLAPATGGAVALVSGRRIDDLDRLLAPHRLAAAGVHGLERRDAAGRLHAAARDAAALADVRERLQAFVAQHAGLLLEDKGATLALHYRRRPELADEVRSFVADVGCGLPPGFEVLRGRMVFEIKPHGVSKGRAIRDFMAEPPFAGRTAVFVGDDVTDESGFELVNSLDGVSIKVSDGTTRARWRLPSVGAVLEWLELIVGQRRKGSGSRS